MTDAATEFAAVPLFAPLSEAQQAALALRCPPRTFPGGALVRRRGDPTTHLLVLLQGTLRAVVSSPEGRLVVLDRLTAPRAVDKLAAIDGGPCSADYWAVCDCRIGFLDRRVLLKQVDDAAELRHHVLRTLAASTRAAQSRLVEGILASTQVRVATWLLSEAARQPEAMTTPIVPLPGSQDGLAAHLGVTRVSVNRALGNLRRQHLVQIRRGAVVLLDPERLAASTAHQVP